MLQYFKKRASSVGLHVCPTKVCAEMCVHCIKRSVCRSSSALKDSSIDGEVAKQSGAPSTLTMPEIIKRIVRNDIRIQLQSLTCIVGCIECPWETYFSSVSNNKGNRKLPFDMGFKNIEKFFRNFNVSCSHQRAKVTENRDFS